jgi:hypothetical protein
MKLVGSSIALGVVIAVSAPVVHAEEGLWTLDQAARPEVALRLGLPDDEDLRRRLGANIVHFPSGASGTVVSSRGLVVSVRDVALPCLNAASRMGTDHVRDGFQAGARGDLRCPGLSVDRLVDREEVTLRARQGLARGEAIPVDRLSTLERECREASGLECRVTLLFDGAIARLDRFQRHRDVRLVFTPESRIAAFGNATARRIFPRYALDVAFFRIYENGQPLPTPSPIVWNAAGAAKQDPVVVAGYPEATERTLPWAFLAPLGSSIYRWESTMAREQAQALQTLSREIGESSVQEHVHAGLERLASDLRGAMAVLQNHTIQRKLRVAEAGWRELVAKHGAKTTTADWAEAATAAAHFEALHRRYLVLEGDRVRPFGGLFDVGRELVRWCEERKKPEADRLPEYRGSGLAEVEHRLAAPLPFSGPAEAALLEAGLLRLRAELDAKEPLARILDAESPADRATRIVASTRIGDETVRQAIFGSGKLGEADDDELIVFVKMIETEAGPLQWKYEREVRHHLSIYARSLGEALSAADRTGDSRYSNVNHDLRLSSGRVRGFLDFGRDVPAVTTLGGLISRAARAQPGSPWRLPRRWQSRQRQVDLAQPLNFIIDADVGSGAPGAAVLNRKGEFIGMVIDSTLKSAVNRFIYRGGDERAVAVHPAGILEAIRRVYGAEDLADELASRQRN